MSVIQIENLVKKYGANVAVDGLNLEIEGGKVYGFLGPNGAGKSTTMNIITGYIGATSGTVKADEVVAPKWEDYIPEKCFFKKDDCKVGQSGDGDWISNTICAQFKVHKQAKISICHKKDNCF